MAIKMWKKKKKGTKSSVVILFLPGRRERRGEEKSDSLRDGGSGEREREKEGMVERRRGVALERLRRWRESELD